MFISIVYTTRFGEFTCIFHLAYFREIFVLFIWLICPIYFSLFRLFIWSILHIYLVYFAYFFVIFWRNMAYFWRNICTIYWSIFCINIWPISPRWRGHISDEKRPKTAGRGRRKRWYLIQNRPNRKTSTDMSSNSENTLNIGFRWSEIQWK